MNYNCEVYSMSSLLDEAIVDAKALREAVLKNAEASLLEAYAPKIEEAVEQLLEQDPAAAALPMDIGAPPMDIGAMPGGLGVAPEPMDAETGDTFLSGEKEDISDVKFAALADLDDESSLDDDVEIDITRGELQTMLESITKDIEDLEEMHCGGKRDEEGDEEEEEHIAQSEVGLLEIDDDILEAFSGLGEDTDTVEEEIEEAASLSEEAIEEIVESLVVDIMPTKSGWAGTPESVMQHNEELAAAMAQSDKVKEERNELLKVGKELAESVKKHQSVNTKLKDVVDILKEKLDEVNLSNAKLLYTNRVLKESSLNERQKETIVEALSNAGSVNEAKVMFETLQSTVGSSIKKGPKSLNEAVSRPSTILPRRKSQDNQSDSFTDRMKVLAGIKN
jgi:hypothetical protein